VLLKDAGQNVLGRLTYVHLANQAPVGDSWPTNVGTWTIRFLGTPAASQEAGCDWTGVHLHQGQTLSSAQITYNTALPAAPGVINPANDPANNWMHKVTLIDSDGDGCSDQEELGPNQNLGGRRDPHNFWDFFDVPVPASYIGDPASTKDKFIGVADAVALKEKMGTNTINDGVNQDGDAQTDEDPPDGVDNDHDGRIDEDGGTHTLRPGGVWQSYNPAFDRTLLGPDPWDTGPGDGAVSIADVIYMRNQFGHSCTAAP